jgi:hypothetical protein
MNLEASADPRAKIGAIVVEAIRVAEAELGMSIWEYRARRDMPAELNLDVHAIVNAIRCFQLLKCGRWLPLNWYAKPLGHNGIRAGDPPYAGDEAYADQAVLLPKDAHKLVNVWSCIGRDPMALLVPPLARLYLYNDHTPGSLKGYYLRLARLCAAMDPWRTEGEAPGGRLMRGLGARMAQ